MIEQGEKSGGMLVVRYDRLAHFSVFACWPVEGAAVLVVPTAGARHDLFFYALASFLSLSRLTSVPPDED